MYSFLIIDENSVLQN